MTFAIPTPHQQGAAPTSKIMIDRYHGSPSGVGSYYGSPGSSYFPPPPQSQAPDQDGFANKNHYSGWSGGGGKGNAAVSALTLLAFLFFLNVLQQCINDQMTAMNPQVMIMTSGRVDEDQLTFKTRNLNQETRTSYHAHIAGNKSVKHSERTPVKYEADNNKHDPTSYESRDDEGFAGFVSAMTDDEA